MTTAKKPLVWYKNVQMYMPFAFTLLATIIGVELFRQSTTALQKLGVVVELSRNPSFPLLLYVMALLVILLVAYFALQVRTSRIDILEEYDREKSSFIRMASDAIRTPLTAVKWLTELFLGGSLGNLSPMQRENMVKISTAIERLIAQVNELLQISQMSRGYIHYDPKPGDLNKAIAIAIDIIHPLIEAKDQTLSFRKMREVERVTIDLDLVRHVVQVMLSNAVRVTPRGGVLKVGMDVTETEIVVGVSDAGEGVDENQAKELFSNQSTTLMPDAAEDRYLFNLNVSKQIMSQAGGRLWYENEPGHGATFYFALPRSIILS